MFPRVALEEDVPSIVRLVNRAYEVEAFFVAGDRTSAAAVRALMRTGHFLVVGTRLALTAAIFTTTTDGRGYFGMLAVDPMQQGRGLGRTLIEAAERAAREAGCRAMDIKVVNLRTDLVALYERFGYAVAGTEPYEQRPVIKACHFVAMTKPLG